MSVCTVDHTTRFQWYISGRIWTILPLKLLFIMRTIYSIPTYVSTCNALLCFRERSEKIVKKKKIKIPQRRPVKNIYTWCEKYLNVIRQRVETSNYVVVKNITNQTGAARLHVRTRIIIIIIQKKNERFRTTAVTVKCTPCRIVVWGEHVAAFRHAIIVRGALASYENTGSNKFASKTFRNAKGDIGPACSRRMIDVQKVRARMPPESCRALRQGQGWSRWLIRRTAVCAHSSESEFPPSPIHPIPRRQSLTKTPSPGGGLRFRTVRNRLKVLFFFSHWSEGLKLYEWNTRARRTSIHQPVDR